MAARGRGYGFYLTSESATLALTRDKASPRGRASGARLPSEFEQAVVRMRVLGGRTVQPSVPIFSD